MPTSRYLLSLLLLLFCNLTGGVCLADASAEPREIGRAHV